MRMAMVGAPASRPFKANAIIPLSLPRLQQSKIEQAIDRHRGYRLQTQLLRQAEKGLNVRVVHCQNDIHVHGHARDTVQIHREPAHQ